MGLGQAAVCVPLDAAAKVRHAMASEGATVALLSQIAQRLGDASARESALAAAERLAGGDAQFTRPERSLLDRARQRFSMPD